MTSRLDDIREEQRRLWEKFSPGWGKWDQVTLPMLSTISDRMLERIGIGCRAAHLDIASGTGEPGLTIAGLACEGRVVMVDFSPGMLHFARRRASALGLGNIEFLECSADNLPLQDDSFDSITCRMGLMFFPDAGAAIREMHRVLKPGGKAAVAVWAGPEENLWAAMPMAAIARELGTNPPGPDAPGLFRFAESGDLADRFRRAGFSHSSEEDVCGKMVSRSAEEYWEHMTEVAAPIVSGLSQATQEARKRIGSEVIEFVRQFEDAAGNAIPYRARICVAQK